MHKHFKLLPTHHGDNEAFHDRADMWWHLHRAGMVMAAVVALMACLTIFGGKPANLLPTVAASEATSATASQPIRHFFEIVAENTSEAELLNDWRPPGARSDPNLLQAPKAPFLQNLSKVGATEIANPTVVYGSGQAYWEEETGHRWEPLQDDNPATQINAPIITDQLGTKWKSYQESLPAPGWMGMRAPATTGDYEAQHNPFRYFTHVSQRAHQRNLMVPLTQLARDLQSTATTPEYAEITPNLCNDMHDDCGGRVNLFDQWLNAQAAIIFNSPAWKTQNCLLEIQIDEGDPNYGKGQYMTMYVGPSVMKGAHSTAPYTHESSLEVAERALGLKPFSGTDREAPIPRELFKPQSQISQGGLNTTPNSERISTLDDPNTPAPPTPREGLS